jgi:hypothetical protein
MIAPGRRWTPRAGLAPVFDPLLVVREQGQAGQRLFDAVRIWTLA